MIPTEGTVRYHLSIFQHLGIWESIMSLDIWYSTKIPLNCSDHSITAHLLRIVDLFIQCVIKVQSDISKQIRFFERHVIVQHVR